MPTEIPTAMGMVFDCGPAVSVVLPVGDGCTVTVDWGDTRGGGERVREDEKEVPGSSGVVAAMLSDSVGVVRDWSADVEARGGWSTEVELGWSEEMVVAI